MDLFHVPIIYLKECIDPRGGEGGGAVHAELRDTEEIGVFKVMQLDWDKPKMQLFTRNLK